MLIIPEIKKVVIMPPRSGSTALKKALLDKYEKAESLYRHGEWRMTDYMTNYVSALYTPVYILRDPAERMVSLWQYMQDVSPERNQRAPKSWIDRVNADASRPFSHWLHTSTELFNESNAHPTDGSPASYYCTFFQVPATRKSARHFLADARDIEIVRFGDDRSYLKALGVPMPERDNASTYRPVKLSSADRAFIEEHHHSDMILGGLK